MVKYSGEALDATFSALSDPTRRAILAQLARGESTVKSLAAPFDMSLPAVSKHLRVLESAGLLKREIDGRIHRCRLAPNPLKSAGAWIEHYRRFWEGQFDALAEFLESPEANKEKATWQSRNDVTQTQAQQKQGKPRPGLRSKSAGRSTRRAKGSMPPGPSGSN
jgi:DNA-binding transcriptional ArsR family regulator